MTDSDRVPDAVPSPVPPPPRRRRRWIVWVAAVILVPILFLVIYTAISLHWSYADGEHAGILQKFSHKGWVCKTWEGELAMTTVPGVAPTMWNFSVRDEDVVKQLNEVLGKRVVLHFAEHRGIPSSCFGETNFFVNGVTTIHD
jgi:hypothetical protein